MIEGYDHDDIYIMVEDEFHAVAQTFTQHLHHAEYQRLKKKARDAAPPTFKPTEAMRAEARKRMEAGALQARQKHALGNLTNGVNLSADEDEEQEDDPWLGTSLAGLMADAGNQKKTALVGLEKIQSSTRAAKGFGRGTGDSPANRKEKMNVSDIFGVSRKGEQDVHNSSENDSGRPTKAKSVPSKPRSHENPGSDEAGDVRGATSNAISTTSSMPESSSKRDATDSISRSRVREPSVAARRLFEDFDKFDNLDRPDKVTRKPRPSPSRKDRNSRPAKDNKLRLSDIPTFLV